MGIIRSSLSSIVVGLLAFAPVTAAAENAKAVVDSWPEQTLTVDTIVKKHIAALGGEKLLRASTSLTFTVSGEKKGQKFEKTVVQVRPNKVRVDIVSAEGRISKGFDGKTAWVKKGDAAAFAMSPEETKAMQSYASFEEPLLDYAKKGTTVKLVGKTDVKGTPAYDLEVTLKTGEVEHHFLDAKTFLLVKRTFPGKDKDGKPTQMSVRFGDYKKVQGRMVNHAVAWEAEDGTEHETVVSRVAWDKKFDNKLFAMPR